MNEITNQANLSFQLGITKLEERRGKEEEIVNDGLKTGAGKADFRRERERRLLWVGYGFVVGFVYRLLS